METLEKNVTVRFNRTNGTLTIDPPEIRLGDREWVRWTFEGLQGTEFGFISFADPIPRFGPFHALRTFNSTSVLGKGNKGTTGPFAYTALVLDLNLSDPVASGQGTIENTTTVKNTAPDIEVIYHGETDPPHLEVIPERVGLNTGDTATWHFRGLPPNAFACFNFPDKKLGPFVAFSACRNDDACTAEASGMGFAVTGLDVKEISYHIELRAWNGCRLASDDPLIDNLGPPIG